MSKKPEFTTLKVDAAENELVNCFRSLRPEHTKLAFLVLLQSAAYGQKADKLPRHRLVRP